MSYYAGDYDIAVIGAGHAGCEAGLAAARLGMKTLVFSISLFALLYVNYFIFCMFVFLFIS